MAAPVNGRNISAQVVTRNSTSIRNYEYTDKDPFTGVSYYRLKQTDFNGNYKYSKTVSVNIESTNDFDVINTYTSSSELGLDVTINCNSNCQLNLELYSMFGVRVSETIQNKGSDKVIIPTSGLSKGIYLLKVFNADKTICIY